MWETSPQPTHHDLALVSLTAAGNHQVPCHDDIGANQKQRWARHLPDMTTTSALDPGQLWNPWMDGARRIRGLSLGVRFDLEHNKEVPACLFSWSGLCPRTYLCHAVTSLVVLLRNKCDFWIIEL